MLTCLSTTKHVRSVIQGTPPHRFPSPPVLTQPALRFTTVFVFVVVVVVVSFLSKRTERTSIDP